LRRPAVVSVLGGELVALPDIGYGAGLGRGGRLTTRLALRLAGAVTCGSRPLAGDVRRTGGPVPLLLPLGVDLETFAPGGAGPSRTPTVLFVGSLEPVKDPRLLLRAFAALAGDRPDLRLRVVGDGGLRGSLEAEVTTRGLAHRVAFDGPVARRDLPAIYRAATVLAVPSRHEAQSMVAVEAAACGLPVVGSRVGAVAELAEVGAALAIPPTDGRGLREALAAVLDDPNRAASMAATGRATAIERWDIGTTSSAVVGLYERLVRPPARGDAPGDERS
jgi:glycosyltransferase involved in cell wall biosynthesis